MRLKRTLEAWLLDWYRMLIQAHVNKEFFPIRPARLLRSPSRYSAVLRDISKLGITVTNPRLTKEQRDSLFRPLFASIVQQIETAAGSDEDVLWALRRKIAKELVYLERSPPAVRTKLKKLMRQKQEGLCAICGEPLPEKGAELDRTIAKLGYIESNVRLVHHHCHVQDQESKGYA